MHSHFRFRLSLLAALACGALGLPSGARATPTVIELPSPAPADSGESSLHTGPDGTSYLTFSAPGAAAGERALWLATLLPGDAASWSAPRPIVSTPRLMENWADFASLTVGTDGQLWAQWFQRREDENAHGYDGWIARSADRGATWTPPAPLGHEFVSLAPLGQGRVLAVWLESTRAAPAPGATASHEHAPADRQKNPSAPYAPAMRLKSRLLAPDGSTVQDWIVDRDVCTCCQTSLVRLSGDRALVTYRGHTRDEIRDNLFAVLNQTTWSAPRPVHADGWKIAACPVNGPAADARGESLVLAWFTAADGVARVQAKFSRDGGITFSPPLAIDLGHPMGRVDVVKLADDSSLVAWLEAKSAAHAAGLYVRRLFPDGALSAPQLLAATSAVRASGFPRLAVRDGEALPVLVSWTDATPVNPADPKSPAATRVRVARIDAGKLTRTASAAATTATTATPRASTAPTAALEICAAPSGAHSSSPILP
jgi:hypothetical protein